jgi:hypothetical protein
MKNKSTKLMIMTILCFLLSAGLFSTSVFAITGFKFNSVVAQQQEKSNWCWAATASMAAKYLGVNNATQSNIVTAVFGSAWNFAGSIYDIRDGLDAFDIYSVPNTSPVSFLQITNDIDMGSNVIALVDFTDPNQFFGHAFLIRGYYFDTSVGHQNIYYIDPQDASAHVNSYSSFNSNSSWYWKHTVYNIMTW